MINLSLKEILDIPQLKYSLYILEDDFFIYKLKDRKMIYDETFGKTDMDVVINKEYQFYSEIPDLYIDDNDGYMTAVQTDMTKRLYLKHENVINKESLILFLGSVSGKYLKFAEDVKNKCHSGRDEYGYSNGEIIVFNENRIETNNTNFSLEKEQEKLAEAVLITNSILQSNPRIAKHPLKISGTYYERGYEGKGKKEVFDSKTLHELSKSKLVISNLNPDKFDEYIKNNLIDKRDVLKYIERGLISKDIAIDLMIKGTLTEDFVLNKIFNIKKEKDLVFLDDISLYSKILLYSAGKIDISTLEEVSQRYIDKDEQIPKEKFLNLVTYYNGNINKISELLTHNVLDFTKSMEFLDSLVEGKAITPEDKSYLIGIMNDFKTNELLNHTENASKEWSNHPIVPRVHSHGVTIDPEIRKQYFKSIGDVKDIFINGQTLIRDDSEGVSKKNSLDGYQLIIIPDKKIAVLEKFYEVTRDKNENIVYKKDENGNLIAAIENATYIMPIGMAKDFAERKNKQQLRQSPYVTSVSHTMNWIRNTENAIALVAERAGLQVEFSRENTEKWSKLVKENYEVLKEKRDKNIDDLL